MNIENVPFYELRDGRKVFAKIDRHGDVHPKTFVNVTQAKKACTKLGARWYVTGHYPFYATYGASL